MNHIGEGEAAVRDPRDTEAALAERVKELECLYAISRALRERDAPLETLLGGILDILPGGFQYPPNAKVRLTVDGRVFASPDYPDSPVRLSCEVRVGERSAGTLTVCYPLAAVPGGVSPFLPEESLLLEKVAAEAASVVERARLDGERAMLQDQLQHADRLATIGEMAAGVAHEINEPLSAVLGFAQLARRADGLPPRAARDIDKIVEASLRARETVRRMLAFARRDAARRIRCDLGRLAADALAFLEPRMRRDGIELRAAFASAGTAVDADPTQIGQVVVNLAVNAIQAMPRGGSLTVETSRRGREAVLTVADTGMGMADDVKARIFSPFFTTKGPSGTGLGLPVARGIVAGHGGTIEVESAPGQGSRFTLRFPAAHGEGR